VDDARTAPETFELDASYLEPRGIASMLDAPVFAEGDVWGILCHEHVGEVRSWQPTEIAFAISVADMLSTLLEQARRIFLADELRSRDAEIARTKANDALVQLAGSVAHDFNTVLQTILLLTESAAEETTLASATSHVQAVVDECKRGSRMARRLLESVRRTAVPPARLDLSRVLQDMERGISALVSPRSTATVSTAAEAWVIGELVEFEQIVLNLVTNARDASASGGRISVVVEKTHDSVTLEVADGGSGIDPATLPRIFDPFFTTKPRGAGTGVGLATVRALVEARGGAVDVTTKLGQGTTIRVRWPAASAD
jgi:signal transduction histidine kinase